MACSLSCEILEASNAVGGRVRTDQVNGFLLDRGFQVLLTAYPETQRVLDYAALDLQPFYPGALVYLNHRFHRVADPWRHPVDAVRTLFSPIGALMDKLRVGRLRRQVRKGSLEALLRRPEQTTLGALETAGFSTAMIDHFFRPFLGGIFLERHLQTSSRLFEFVFRMFSEGDAALPANGMGAISEQLAADLPEGVLHLNTPAHTVTPNFVTLASGETRQAGRVVIATENPEAARLLHDIDPIDARKVTCLYFAAEKPPVDEAILILNGENDGPVNNVCLPSAVASSYAPAGAALFSATVLDDLQTSDAQLASEVRSQMTQWFGGSVRQWQHLRTYRIPHALPAHTPNQYAVSPRPARLESGVYICGDYRESASIHGAMVSGRRAAEAIIHEVGA
jgi:phytoene dehydrogenase-like protein